MPKNRNSRNTSKKHTSKDRKLNQKKDETEFKLKVLLEFDDYDLVNTPIDYEDADQFGLGMLLMHKLIDDDFKLTPAGEKAFIKTVQETIANRNKGEKDLYLDSNASLLKYFCETKRKEIMVYMKQALIEYYADTANGRQKEEYVCEGVNALLDNWVVEDQGIGLYKLTGRFWEVLYPILKKYAPIKLVEYEKLVGEFEVFNERVKKLVDYDDELCNWIASILNYNSRFSFASPNDVDLVNDPVTDDDIAYLPNQEIDTNAYLGRE
ncbi:MAG: hypothetical protein NTX65_15000 [Ignavibacteriales bacterium]|nr:hypothetical protein [Ignavibacteriales bacterium]